jgi:hypothetical protein
VLLRKSNVESWVRVVRRVERECCDGVSQVLECLKRAS